MARKKATVTIDDADSRDAGKIFLVTEMDAEQGEKFAARVILAMIRSGVDVPEDLASMGMRGLALMGIQALNGLAWADLEPLLDQMFLCMKRIVPAKPDGRNLIKEDIEEIATRFRLRKEWATLQFGFSTAGSPSTSDSPAQPLA